MRGEGEPGNEAIVHNGVHYLPALLYNTCTYMYLLLCQVSQEDIENIVFLCDQIIEITEYRTQLYDYLKNR